MEANEIGDGKALAKKRKWSDSDCGGEGGGFIRGF